MSVTGESTVKGHNCSPPKTKIGRLGLHTVFVLLSDVHTQKINNLKVISFNRLLTHNYITRLFDDVITIETESMMSKQHGYLAK